MLREHAAHLQRGEGTVTLYAIIRADGSVDGVKVLLGVDDTLDENARIALSHWQFRPATRHGVAVDLGALIQIPLRRQEAAVLIPHQCCR